MVCFFCFGRCITAFLFLGGIVFLFFHRSLSIKIPFANYQSTKQDDTGTSFYPYCSPPGVVTASTASELSSYCNDGEDDEDEVDGTKRRQRRRRLDLQAPSRLFRESFLLALGIAMYSGNISGLGTKTMLFPNPPVVAIDDDTGGEGDDGDDSIGGDEGTTTGEEERIQTFEPSDIPTPIPSPTRTPSKGDSD